MRSGSIWWGQIGNSIRLLSKVIYCLKDCRSTVFQIPDHFPWRSDFYEVVDIRRSSFCGDRILERLSWRGNMDPGAFVLEELCPKEVQINYWPGQTCAAYLAAQKQLLLHSCYVWVTGIHSRLDLLKWSQFVAQYERCVSQPDSRAVFLLEYDGAPVEISGMESVIYRIENYDCRVFCLEEAASMHNTGLRSYQAELALCIGGNNPEFCSALLETGCQLLYDPLQTTADVIAGARSSDGQTFPPLNSQQIHSAAWKAAIVLLFPILEQYRMDFVTKYEAELSQRLPISNPNGEQIDDPYNLEIGPLLYLVSQSAGTFRPEEVEGVRLCRRARNLLAHNKIIPYEEIDRLIELCRIPCE